MFLLFNGHMLKGVLTSGDWRELVLSDCFLGTGQEGEFCIAHCDSFPKNQHHGQHPALKICMRPMQLASWLWGVSMGRCQGWSDRLSGFGAVF